MNAATSEVNKAHKLYLQCVDKTMTEYLSNSQVRRDNKEAEFCVPEKQDYLETMKSNFPHQFETLLRVDANTY